MDVQYYINTLCCDMTPKTISSVVATINMEHANHGIKFGLPTMT